LASLAATPMKAGGRGLMIVFRRLLVTQDFRETCRIGERRQVDSKSKARERAKKIFLHFLPSPPLSKILCTRLFVINV